ncbi:MAG: DegT/DnrJ/EryC1/StrS family aminotransferase, partial [Candidatus Hodarchaeales archaeon]
MIKPFEEPIYITRPIVPNLYQLVEKLHNVYKTRILTNMGPYHEELEVKLRHYLKVNNLSLFNNATIGLITAIKALDLPVGSDVITTPFTFAATPHSIVWNGLNPIFCDIEPKTMTIDPAKIEELISPNTSAILAVHVYGFPCNVDQISKIAIKHNIKVIYDAAHAFTTKIDNESICNYGDISVLSFHATKLFNTLEGGALVYRNEALKRKLYNLKNFGIRDEFTVEDIGINGKLNELQAIFGILNLDLVEEEQFRRKKIREIYEERLSAYTDINIPEMPENVSNSYQYFPILINKSRDLVYDTLKKYNVYARKYFYPPCTEYQCYQNLGNKKNLSVTYDIAEKVLCLPFFGD